MVWKRKKQVEEAEPEVEEEEEEQPAEVPEIEPAPIQPVVTKKKRIQSVVTTEKTQEPTKERIEVVYDFPQRQIKEEVIDGVLVKYITMAEALTQFMNEEE